MESDNRVDEWIQKAMCYRWLHRKSSSFYYKLDLLFTYVIICIGFCNAIITFVCNTYFNDDTHVKEIETFFVSSSSLAIAGIAQLHRKVKFYETSEQHNNHSRLFEVYSRRIRNSWILNPEITLQNIIKEYDELANTSPYIPNKILKLFNVKYGHLQIWKPNALYGLDDLKSKVINKSFFLRKTFLLWSFVAKCDKTNNV